MTVWQRQVCHCPQPCSRYAEGYSAGKDKALTEFLASLNGPPHSEGSVLPIAYSSRACGHLNKKAIREDKVRFSWKTFGLVLMAAVVLLAGVVAVRMVSGGLG